MNTLGVSAHIKKVQALVSDIFGESAKIITLQKVDTGFEVEAEVIEESEHMKRIGIPKPVYDKCAYKIFLDSNFDLVSYAREAKQYGT
jgi:hypothetical protein